jgi:HupE / UreJ protein
MLWGRQSRRQAGALAGFVFAPTMLTVPQQRKHPGGTGFSLCVTLAALLMTAASLSAHVVSMSTGELRVDGPLAVYELRMPMYEIAHVANPQTALIDHVRFAGAHLTSSACHQEGDTYVCTANYEFSRIIDRVEVDCTLFQVTVPNHVHLLSAVEGAHSDQAVFDQTVPRAVIRFRPPSPVEVLFRGIAEGMWRALASPAALFLIALVIAARSPREAVLLTAMYLTGEWLTRPIAPRIPWPLAPRFIEAAVALTVAYLAVEILALPKAGKRWAVVLVLGLFHGLYFASFPATYLAGAMLLQVALIAGLCWIALRWSTPTLNRAFAIGLLVISVGWFVFRLARTG